MKVHLQGQTTLQQSGPSTLHRCTKYACVIKILPRMSALDVWPGGEKHHPNGAKKSDPHFKSPSPQVCKHLFTPQATPLGGQLRTLLYFNNPYKVGPRSGASTDSGVYENVCTAVSLWLRARCSAPLQQLVALSCSYVPVSSDRRTTTSLVLFEWRQQSTLVS